MFGRLLKKKTLIVFLDNMTWVFKIQIPYLESFKKVKDLDLTNLSRVLNF